MKTRDEMFAPVLEWLDGGAKETTYVPGFNMEYWRDRDRPDYSGTACGTVCCIQGALDQFNPEMKEVFGLTDTEQCGLFLAAPSWDSGRVSTLLPEGMTLSQVTPAMAAITIRRFLATGEVNWK